MLATPLSFFICIPPEEDTIALKACEIHVSKFVNVREFCPMQQKTIPVENYDKKLKKETLHF